MARYFQISQVMTSCMQQLDIISNVRLGIQFVAAVEQRKRTEPRQRQDRTHDCDFAPFLVGVLEILDPLRSTLNVQLWHLILSK